MNLTLTGAILLILGIGMFAVNPRGLFILVVALLPFTATSVVNVGMGGNGHGLQPSLALGLLLVLRAVFAGLTGRGFVVPNRIVASTLVIFIVLLIPSLTIPLIYAGHSYVNAMPYATSLSNMTLPRTLRLDPHNVTQFGYLFIWALVVLTMARYSRSQDDLVRLVKVIVASGIFVACWGVLQVGLPIFGIPYPHWIFNNSASPAALGYLQEIGSTGVRRMASVTTEPSDLARFLLVTIALVLPFPLTGQSLYGRLKDRGIIWLLTGAALMTTSTTAYAGLVVLGLLGVILSVRFRNFRIRRISRVVIILSVVAGLLYWKVSFLQDVYQQFILDKSQSYSFLQRVASVKAGLSAFSFSPMFGLGIGSVASYSSPVWLVGNAGVVGLIGFSLLAGAIYLSAWRNMVSANRMWSDDIDERRRFCISAGIWLAWGVALFMDTASGPSFWFGFFWIVPLLALSLRTPKVAGNESRLGGSP